MNVYYKQTLMDINVQHVKKTMKFNNPAQIEVEFTKSIQSLQQELSSKWNRYVSMGETLAVYFANQQTETVHKSEHH